MTVRSPSVAGASALISVVSWALLWACIAWVAIGTPVAHAERADRDKPTVIDSDKLNHDDQRQVTVFTGNVVLTKGTLTLRGDRMELWQDAAGNYYGTLNGKPSRFRQKRDGVNEFMEGESLQIDYDGKEEIVVLTHNAIMRRLEGDILRDQVSGDKLTYNNITERYQVDSGEGQGRARMFVMPKSEPEADKNDNSSIDKKKSSAENSGKNKGKKAP